jgi:ATP cone domain
MTDPLPLTWIKKPDGRLLPFDADQISRDLFAATQRLGRADAFLARELTDGAVHFLAAEAENGAISSTQITDTVVKVIRELGHAALSQAFLDVQAQGARTAEPPAAVQAEISYSWDQVNRLVETAAPACALAWQLSRSCLHAYSLRTVFGPDLVAAHEQKLLALGHLDAPLELAGMALALDGADADNPVEAIAGARNLAGQFLAIDGPDHLLTLTAADPTTFARSLRTALLLADLGAVVNLNSALPPTGAGSLADGPLFASQQRAPSAAMADRLVEELLPAGGDGRSSLLRIDWHLAAGDFRPEASGRLLGLVRRALDGAPIAFAMDRPNRPVALAEGIDRRHPALLMTVGLHLPTLADQPAVKRNPVIFLQKLGSLARMALSAGAQKREFLRKHIAGRPGLSRGFLLDRARLAAVPLGLEAAVYALLEQRVCGSAEALGFARQVIDHLRDALQRDGRSRHLETCLDGPFPGDSAGTEQATVDPAASALDQLHAADALLSKDATGTAAVVLPPDESLSAPAVADLLRHAWQKTALVRVRLQPCRVS